MASFWYRASDISRSKKRSKVQAEDVFTALSELDFDKYEESLRDFLRNYNANKEDQARRAPLVVNNNKQIAAEPLAESAGDSQMEDGSVDEENTGLKKIKTI